MAENSDRPLEGQVAVITGAGNGIGLATALRFAAEGAKVVIGELLPETGEAALEAVRAAGGEAVFGQLEASSRESNEALAALAVDSFDGLDILVTAAGISHGGYVSGDKEGYLKWVGKNLENALSPASAFAQIEDEEWRRVIDVNLTGTFYAMQACVGVMDRLKTKGRIITIASIAAKNPDAGPTAYTVSKAGVWMLTKKAARVLAPAGIRVNSIGPGYIETNMTSVFSELEEAQEALLAQVPMGRVGKPSEIASAALFLASDESSYMTGEILHPDGGYFTE